MIPDLKITILTTWLYILLALSLSIRSFYKSNFVIFVSYLFLTKYISRTFVHVVNIYQYCHFNT